jgi:hypothetical protein
MSEDSSDGSDGVRAQVDEVDGIESLAVSSNCKVLGKFAAASGAGVLGNNTAGSGTPIGVEGAVPNSSDGYGFSTPDDFRLEGLIDTAATGFVVEAGTTATGGALSVVLGHASNSAGGTGATVSGGGFDNGSTTSQNQASGDYGTVSGGVANTASATEAAVGGGGGNTASGSNATVGGGEHNTATLGSHGTISGGTSNVVKGQAATVGGGSLNSANGFWATIAGGNENTVNASTNSATIGGGTLHTATKDGATIGGGSNNDANGKDSTVSGGVFNEAHTEADAIGGGFSNRTGTESTSGSLYATIPGGKYNTAEGQYSFAAGRKAEAVTNGSFVWADSTDATVTSTGADQFLVEAGGGVGLGTTSPATWLDVVGPAAGDAFGDPTQHAMLLDNTADDDGNYTASNANGLAIKAGPSGNPGTNVNFISFYNGTGSSYGAIQGNGSGGSEFTSTGSDYAEYMPRDDTDQAFAASDVVGVEAGHLVADAAAADRAMVVSDRHIVLGNDPGPDEVDDHEAVAFTGQVPVRVRGTVDPGDAIVPSGEADGTARAVDPADWDPATAPLVGQAWEGSDDGAVSEVTVAVGIDDPGLLGDQFAARDDRIAALEAENRAKDDRIDEQADRIDDLTDRLAALEARVGSDGTDRPGVAND